MSKIPWSWRDNVKRKRLGAQRERKEEMEEREEEDGGRKGFDIPHCKGMRKSLAYYPCCFAAAEEERESWDTVRDDAASVAVYVGLSHPCPISALCAGNA